MNNKPIFRLVNVSKVYPHPDGDLDVLHGLSAEIPRGLTAIRGSNGEGKSTLLHLLAALDTPTSGEVFLDGERIDYEDSQSVRAARSRVAVVFQENNLIPHLTVLENVALPQILSGVERQCALSAAAEFLHRLGMSARLRHKPHQLAGGQRQRAGIARAFMSETAVILADEPTGNLDPGSGHGVMEEFRSLAHEHDTPVIIVTHNLRLAEEYCDSHFELRQGRLHPFVAEPAPVPNAHSFELIVL